MHCALAALLDEDPEGCFFVAENFPANCKFFCQHGESAGK